MATFVLDTDTLSLYQRNHPQVVAVVGGHSADTLTISAVTLEEQISGWSSLARTALTPQHHEHAAMFLAAWSLLDGASWTASPPGPGP